MKLRRHPLLVDMWVIVRLIDPGTQRLDHPHIRHYVARRAEVIEDHHIMPPCVRMCARRVMRGLLAIAETTSTHARAG